MLYRLLRNNLLKRISNFCTQAKNSFPLIKNTLITFPIYSNLLITQHCLSAIKTDLKNFDLNLKKACDTGEGAIIDLMAVLRACIIETSKQYRDCLNAQMEIIQTASDLGPLSHKWDDLPQFRTLANELNEELDEYAALIKTIGQMIVDESIGILVDDNRQHVKVLDEKCKELDKLLTTEREENKKFERILLRLKRDSILKAT